MKLANHLRRRREKVFCHEPRVALDREAKVRIMHLARALKHRTEPRRHYGVLTGKFVDVLHAMLWLIHDGKSGQCNPSLATIAEKASCARSTVCEAIRALEDAGILSWVNRLVKVRTAELDLFGRTVRAWRVLRTSNAYVFRDPKAAVSGGNATKSEFPPRPLDTSSKKETRGGARLAGAPVYVGRPTRSASRTTAPPLALQGEHGLGGGVPLSPTERAAIIARMDRGEASKEDYVRYEHDLDARINARSAK